MIHVFHKGKDVTKPTLVLFHGTGGNEQDLLPLAGLLSPDSSVLGIRGNVLENGMPRFFRRLAEGVFDEADLIFRTHEIKQFLGDAAAQHGFDANNLVAVGYSNGANIAGSLLFHYKDVFRAAILLHPMVPLRNVELPSLDGASIFIGAGTNDPLIASSETEDLESILQKAGAEVTTHWGNQGHRLSVAEAEAARDWLQIRSTSTNA